jgi:RNA polymerase sigma factor (sigma-70 family)
MARRFDDDPELVRAAQAGDQAAFTTLFQRWFDPCNDVARRIVHDPETAAEVAQDTFLVAWRQLGELRDPSAFGGWVLRTSRNKAINRLERERRSIAVDQGEDPALAGMSSEHDVVGDLAVDDQRDLVWAAAAALGERDASVLDLHLRHGLDAKEIGLALDVTTNNAHQLLFRMKGRLAGAIRAWVVFRGGRPSCPALRDALAAAGHPTFSASTVKLVERHVGACDDCGRRQAAILAPEAMFAAVPLLPVAAVLRDRVAAGLRAEGVPLGPEASVPVAEPETGASADPSGSSGSSGSGDAGGVSGEGASVPGDGSVPAGGEPPTVTGSPTRSATDPGGPQPSSAEGLLVVPVEQARSGAGRVRVGIGLALVLVVVVLVGWALLARADEPALTVVDEVSDTTAASGEPRSGTSADSTPTTALVAPEPEPPADAPPAPGGPPPLGEPEAPVEDPQLPGPPVPPVPPEPPAIPAPPRVIAFTVARPPTPGPAGTPCPAGQWRFAVSWRTAESTAVTVTSTTGPGAATGGPFGAAQVCALTPSATFTLTVVGPGGTTTATA